MQMERCANAWEKGKTRIPRNEGGRSSLENPHGGCGLNPNPAETQSGGEAELQDLGGRAGGWGRAAAPASESGRLWGKWLIAQPRV